MRSHQTRHPAGFCVVGQRDMTDHDQQYDAGRRDADIETCKAQMQYVLTRLQIVEGWQNRANNR